MFVRCRLPDLAARRRASVTAVDPRRQHHQPDAFAAVSHPKGPVQTTRPRPRGVGRRGARQLDRTLSYAFAEGSDQVEMRLAMFDFCDNSCNSRRR